MATPQKFARVLNRDGSFNSRRIGEEFRFGEDVYHRLLTLSASCFILFLVGAYLSTNLLFAVIYFLLPDGSLEGLSTLGTLNRFLDCYFFSVQTLATIGYGKIAPVGISANIVVTFEALTGLIGVAMATGILFARFSKPSAQVIFSNVAILGMHEGNPAFIFRMGNKRTNQIVDATVTVVFITTGITAEKQKFRRVKDLNLIRNRSPLFANTWTVIHPIDEKSPLHGLTLEEIQKLEGEILISLIGYDETSGQTVHSRYSYISKEIIPNHAFEDMLRWENEELALIDLTKIHQTRPLS